MSLSRTRSLAAPAASNVLKAVKAGEAQPAISIDRLRALALAAIVDSRTIVRVDRREPLPRAA